MAEKKKKKPAMITKGRLKSEFGFTEGMIKKYLPEPVLQPNPHYRSAPPMKLWPEDIIQRVMRRKKVKAILDKRNEKTRKKQAALDAQFSLAENTLLSYGIDGMIRNSRIPDREFILHVGPTNSGKTYDALEELKTAYNGVYLGPLRLLALEVYDKLNAYGCPCTLLTGEEKIPEAGSRVTASTVEMLDDRGHYDVAVIDEAQMATDPDRGGFWTKAILLVNARRVHVCMAPEALPVIRQLVENTGSPYTVVTHERLTPLTFAGKATGIQKIEKGDALIVFSRRSVLALAAELEQHGIKASVIYGALPPQARREEVRRFASGETSVVVATDAIGMGISLPIRRILFFETEKFDGKRVRDLRTGEIRQIAGRAGRFGIYDEGFVLSVDKSRMVKNALETEPYPIKHVHIPFPEEALSSGVPLGILFEQWKNLPNIPGYKRQSLEEAQTLLNALGKLTDRMDVRTAYSYVTCPVDTDSRELVGYWLRCCKALVEKKEIPPVDFPENNLSECETAYKAYDIRHQMLRRINIEESTEEDRERLCKKIENFLKKDKKAFLKRCSVCGRILPSNYRFRICDDCFQLRHDWW